MSVLVYIESSNGQIKKTGLEVAYYAAKVAQSLGKESTAILIGKASDPGIVGKYGVSKVKHINPDQSIEFDSQIFTGIIAQSVDDIKAEIVILANTANGKALTGRLAVRLEAGNVSGVNSLPDVSDGFVINKSVYSGKAIVKYAIETHKKSHQRHGKYTSTASSGRIRYSSSY